VPKQILPTKATAIAVVGTPTDTHVTFRNTGTLPDTADFECVHPHSMQEARSDLATCYWRGLSSGIGLPPLIGVLGAVLMENPLGTASWGLVQQSQIQPDFAITAFGVTPSQAEVGQTISPAAFTAGYNRTATGVTVDDGSGPVAVPLPGVAFTRPGPYAKTALDDTQAFLLAANDGGPPSSASTSIAFRPRVYFGSAVPGVYDQAFITALASSALAASRQRLIPFNAAPTERMYYCYPTVYGGAPSNFIDDDTGFPAGFSKVATVPVTNAYGVVVSIDVWASNQVGLGAHNIRVN
jgi:hypothetical protein